MNFNIVVRSFFAVFILACLCQSAIAQGPARFADEIGSYITEKPVQHDGNLVVFTGSSSIRMWKNLDNAFPGTQVINRGFGGSQMSDLLYFLDDLVIKHKPGTVVIYEGDNDLAEGKSVTEILQTAELVVANIHDALPATRIFFLSAKPSIARWDLKDKYVEFNAALATYCKNEEGVDFIDVWNPMLDSSGHLQQDIFISDGLHMNDAGYQIWKRVINSAIEQ